MANHRAVAQKPAPAQRWRDMREMSTAELLAELDDVLGRLVALVPS